MRYLYHLTKPEYLDQILSEGLKPIIGDNSKLVDDIFVKIEFRKEIIIFTERRYTTS